MAKTHRLDGWCEIASLQKMYPRWRERGGVLEVEHRGAWQSTADLVEIKGDLFRVVGRADAVANVAGRKVRLAQVSELAEQVRGVRRAVATAVHNSVAGQVVGLKYAIEPGFEAALVAEELGNHLRARLSKEAWPRFWELDEVGPVNNAKRLAG